MGQTAASLQHVSIFRLGDTYLIGALYDYEADNQEGTASIVVEGTNLSVWIDEADAPKKGRTALTSGVIHVLSATGPIEAFEVKAGDDKVITVPVFSLAEPDELRVAGEMLALARDARKTLTLLPQGRASRIAREWGWHGW